jgi:prolyl oligopeptidase
MSIRTPLLGALLALTLCVSTSTAAEDGEFSTADLAPAEDPYLWLEEVTGDAALAWVRERNATTEKALALHPEFAAIEAGLLAIFDSRQRIPGVVQRGRWLYNFWQDADNPRGLLRRTTLDEYRKPEPAWETVLDVDRLAAEERENWVYQGSRCLSPDHRHCLVSLSRGGADAVVVREFDNERLAFVADGFTLPEAKHRIQWIDRDTLFVASDFGPGTLTDSGYPRVLKIWRRGSALTDATTVFEGERTDVSVGALVFRQRGFASRELVYRARAAWDVDWYLRDRDTGVLSWLNIPRDADPGFHRDVLTVQPRSDWAVGGRTYRGGSLLAIPFERYAAGARDFTVVFEPDARRSLASVSATREALLLDVLDNVRSRLFAVYLHEGQPVRLEVALPGPGTAEATGLDPDDTDDYLLSFTDFLTPSSLYLGNVAHALPEKLKALPAFFDAEPYETLQWEATSRDGTRIPYFVVKRKDAKLDGSHPTLLYGYGGFEVSQLPRYSAGVGVGWLSRGGVYVVANIRGGGEFGPAWHQAALKHNRQRSFDDFIAVAEDLVARGLTVPAKLAIEGGSNGGLLVGAAMTQRPELFRAVVCEVPLLDMHRYHKLLAGASWIGEYGDPERADDWAYLSRYSPYHNLRKDVRYPAVLFVTSTRDDRVHPAHARKMAARMEEQGHRVLYFENVEGGHATGTNNRQRARLATLTWAFLLTELGVEPARR